MYPQARANRSCGVSSIGAYQFVQADAASQRGLTLVLGPMTSFIAVVASISLLGTLVAGVAAHIGARDFFARLVSHHRELSESFPKPGFNTRYGPIRPSHMSYLKARLHLQLPEPELQRAGARVLSLLYAHAVLFTAFLLLALWWGYRNGA